ncbi:hypothetical protein [Mucilaginibacter sp.]|uniref:hypothetical protein n=1 Tax=Mucilaginibacter sp. TaxID=1882438 RepID=UPI003B00F099
MLFLQGKKQLFNLAAMHRRLLFFLFLLMGCQRAPRQVNTSFYFWKTGFKLNPAEQKLLNQLQPHKLYVRIMDVDLDENTRLPVPVSPVVFREKLPDSLAIVPVVFVVNDALRNLNKAQLEKLSHQIIYFVNGKVKQAGKNSFEELQLDCDWTATTRNNYFYLLKNIKKQLKTDQVLSVTLRLHQLKNQLSAGIPPANRVMLMCYNMGNLRKYGRQNSILEVTELKKYAGDNLTAYPLPADIGLPLFSWAVVFRNQQYAGISKRLNYGLLQNKSIFQQKNTNFYVLKTALPALGLKQNDEIRWENVTADDLRAASNYLSRKMKPGPFNLLFFDLDGSVIKNYTYEELENISRIFR